MPHGKSAIDGDGGSGYIPRRVGAQEGDGGADLLGGAEAGQRHQRRQIGPAVLGDARRSWRW